MTTTVIPALKAGIHFHPPMESATRRHSLRADTAFRRCDGDEAVAAPPGEKSKWIPAFAGMTSQKPEPGGGMPFSSSKGFFNSPPSVGGDDQWHIFEAYSGSGRPQGAAPTEECGFVRLVRYAGTRQGREVESGLMSEGSTESCADERTIDHGTRRPATKLDLHRESGALAHRIEGARPSIRGFAATQGTRGFRRRSKTRV